MAMPIYGERITRRRSSVVLGCCLGVVFAGTAAWAADGGSGDGSAINNPVERQSLQDLSATHERPLFSPLRRPPPKAVAAAVIRQEAPPPPAPPPSIVVLGIVGDDGEHRAAIRSAGKRSADKVMRVRAGDDVDGWTVERIEPRRLVLTQGERSVDFVLFGAAEKAMKAADAGARGRPER